MPCSVNGTTMDCDFDLDFSTSVPVEATEVIVGTAISGSYLSCGATPRGLNLTDEEEKYPLADGCPGFLYALGTTSTRLFNDTSVSQGSPDVYGSLCHEHLEEVQSKVTFNMPDLSISIESPPEPLEDTARKLNVTYENYTGPNYYNSLETLMDALPRNNSQVGTFMDAIIRGKGGIDVNTLIGREGIPNLTKAAQELYATYMVQAIDANFRILKTVLLTTFLSSKRPRREPCFSRTESVSSSTRTRSRCCKQCWYSWHCAPSWYLSSVTER